MRTKRRAGCALPIARADALEEGLVLTLEAVRRTHRASPPGGDRGRQVEPQRQLGLQALLHPIFELRQHREIEPAPTPLIRKGRVSEAIAQHAHASRQSRGDDLLDVVAPRRKDKQRLGQRIHRRMKDELAQLLGKQSSARLARDHEFAAAAAQVLRNDLQVARFAGPVDAFEGDEAPRLHLPRWYWFTARLCAGSVSLNSLLPSPRATK
jgi:hypothetical protein